MNNRTSSTYWESLQRLPESIQHLARENFELFKRDPRHPSLHFKKVGKYWSVRISQEYRALAFQDDEDLIWIWAGPHDEYQRMIKG